MRGSSRESSRNSPEQFGKVYGSETDQGVGYSSPYENKRPLVSATEQARRDSRGMDRAIIKAEAAIEDETRKDREARERYGASSIELGRELKGTQSRVDEIKDEMSILDRQIEAAYASTQGILGRLRPGRKDRLKDFEELTRQKNTLMRDLRKAREDEEDLEGEVSSKRKWERRVETENKYQQKFGS